MGEFDQFEKKWLFIFLYLITEKKKKKEKTRKLETQTPKEIEVVLVKTEIFKKPKKNQKKSPDKQANQKTRNHRNYVD